MSCGQAAPTRSVLTKEAYGREPPQESPVTHHYSRLPAKASDGLLSSTSMCTTSLMLLDGTHELIETPLIQQ
ncbi:hypothetical protein [Scytonema sp. NUACC21]